MKSIYIWGTGDIGRRIVAHFGENWNIVFVDSNEQLADTLCMGKKVISTSKYIRDFSDEIILIAHLYEAESIKLLENYNIIHYFNHCNLPGEFQEPCPREHLKKYITDYLGDRNDFVLYGLDLYSILIDDWLYDLYQIHPYILVQKDIPSEFVNKIKQKYPDLNIVDTIEQLNSNIQEVCVCTFNYKEVVSANIFFTYKLTNIFDCLDKIKYYHNPAIEKFHNIHYGQRCFIVATGPSLRIEDLDFLKDKGELCISMNSIYPAFDKTNWRPDYYMALDWRQLNDLKDIIDEWSVEASFISNDSEDFWKMKHNENVYCYHQNYGYCFDRLPEFSEDVSRGCYIGGTITYTCIQLAVYMGFRKIYLLGVDFSYNGTGKNQNYTHFYGEDKSGKSVGYAGQVSMAYLAAKQYAESHGIEIYNATRGGKLEIFPRVNFDNLFN